MQNRFVFAHLYTQLLMHSLNILIIPFGLWQELRRCHCSHLADSVCLSLSKHRNLIGHSAMLAVDVRGMGAETTVSGGCTVFSAVLSDVSVSRVLEDSSDFICVVGGPPLLGLERTSEYLREVLLFTRGFLFTPIETLVVVLIRPGMTTTNGFAF